MKQETINLTSPERVFYLKGHHGCIGDGAAGVQMFTLDEANAKIQWLKDKDHYCEEVIMNSVTDPI